MSSKNKELSIEELEMQMYGSQEGSEPASSAAKDESSSTAEERGTSSSEGSTGDNGEAELAGEADTKDPVITEENKEVQVTAQVEDYEKRYKNFKPKADRTIFSLRKEVASLKKKLAKTYEDNLNLKGKLKSIPESKTYTQEQIDYLGDEGIAVMEQLVSKAVNPLKQKLKETEAEKRAYLKQEAVDVEEKAYDTFLSNLEALVPDYESINVDPAFIAYLDTRDERTGYTHKELFSMAEGSGDASRVAKFFKSYISSLGSNSREAILSNKLSPSSTTSRPSKERGSGSGKGVEPITTAFISKFYDDATKGKYSVKEEKRIESRIAMAMKRGEILK